MINFYNQVPTVYTNASRDFQYISWLINIVLNSVKHDIDGIYRVPKATWDSRLIELLAMTLGFKVKRSYDTKQLAGLVAILPSVLRCKGTTTAIKQSAVALVAVTGALGDADVEVNGTEVRITLPKDITDITLFIDLLDYILPAGMTYRIVRKNETRKPINDINVWYNDKLRLVIADDFGLNRNTGAYYGISNLYDFIGDLSSITANVIGADDKLMPNIGLLDNALIPVLDGSPLVDKAKSIAALCSLEDNGTHLLLLSKLSETDRENVGAILTAYSAVRDL